jgi:hypothetical protein
MASFVMRIVDRQFILSAFKKLCGSAFGKIVRAAC